MTGRTVDNFRIEGEVQKKYLQLRLTYRGKLSDDVVLWEEEDYCFVAEIGAIIHNHGKINIVFNMPF